MSGNGCAHIKCTILFCLLCVLVYLSNGISTDSIEVSTGAVKVREATFTDCGRTLRSPKGVISTLDFPNAYPLPIHCQWVIEAPSDKVVVLYFTQFYMREGVSISEYAFYSDNMYLGKKDFGTISSDREPTYLVSNKPILVMDFEMRESGNVHLRVREHLLNVFGFNITYEMIGRNESVKKDPCLYNHCSFTGYCVASSSHKKYFCKCFEGFFGSECQYDKKCGPSGDNGFCYNGGTCRYYIGSTVKSCECTPGFEGNRCEKKIDPRLPSQCSPLGCSQTCFLTSKGDYKCSCFNGFHLDLDEKSCVEKGRIRYLVSFKVYDQNVDLEHLDSSRYNTLKAGIESTLLQLFQPRLYKADNLKVLAFKPAAVVQFHFFGESEDTHRAKALFEENLKRGRIGRYAVDKNFLEFQWEPALSIKSIETSEKMPLAEGSELTLACIVQGSVDMKVRWFKDGDPIDINTNYRNIRIDVTPKNSKDQYSAIIGFEKTHILDAGEFTCQVSDWGTVQNKSYRVTVIKVPIPTVIPLTATVQRGSMFVITCLADEEMRSGSYGYNWLKNERILNPSSEPESIEDLFPGGSRLVVKEASESSKYVCLTTNRAGSSKRESIVTVLTPGDGTPLCIEEVINDVKWEETASNTKAIQPCPNGYNGEVERYCVMKDHNLAIWNDPDYSNCLPADLANVKTQLERMQLGYMVSDVGSLLRKLRDCLQSMRDGSELPVGEPVVDILEDIQEYQRLQSNVQNVALQNYTQIFMDIASLLVETPKLIQKQSHIIKLHKQILGYGLSHGTSLPSETFHFLQRNSLVLEVGRIRNEVPQILRFPSGIASNGNDVPEWLTDSVELELDSWFLNKVSGKNDSLSIAVVFYRNLTAFFPQRFVAKHSFASYDAMNEPDLEYQLHSRLVAVAMQPSFRTVSNIPSKRSVESKLKVKARLAHLNHTVNRRILWNISCGMADFSEGNVQFSMEGCIPVQTGLFSLCQCDRVGTYVVLLTTYAPTDDIQTSDVFDTNAGVGCAVGAFFVCLTFFILVVLWRKIKGAVTILKIQFCVAIIAAYGGILKSLQSFNNKDMYHYSVPFVQFFLLAAYSIQLCVGLSVYFEFVGFKTMHYKKLKFAILAWAVPLIVVGASLVAQVPDDSEFKSWWIKLYTKEFYAFSASAIILVVLQIMLLAAVRTEMKYYSAKDSKKHAKCSNRWSLISRSIIITFFLTLTSASSILYVNYDESYYRHAFGICSSLLGFVTFLCYTACSENVQSLCSSENSIEEDSDYNIKEELSMNPQKSPFDSFLKPEVVGGAFVSGKLPGSLDIDEKQLQKLGHLAKRDEQDWRDIEQLLLQKKEPTCIVRDFTVHHHHQQQQASMTSLPRDAIAQDGSKTIPRSKKAEAGKPEEPNSVGFQLQQLEESPKSSHLQLEDDDSNYALNHHGSAPDILETTSHQSTLERRSAASCRAEDKSALPSEHSKLVCSTFLQLDGQSSPVGVLDVVSGKPVGHSEHQIHESDSDDQKPGMHSTPPCPPIQSMIGDDKLICPSESAAETSSIETESSDGTLKKRFMKKGAHVGLNVPIPKVPDKVKLGTETDSSAQQAKKGWNITTV